jgi:hypothetical protein
MRSPPRGRGALLGNRTNPQEARRLGQAAVRAKAEGFALAVAPIIAGIVASGIGTEAGIAEALNARGIATARGGNWFAQTVKNARARAARLSSEGVARSAIGCRLLLNLASPWRSACPFLERWASISSPL